ncbi:unnamed protein product [Mycena citricolor]|uniref:Glycosyltransferase 61 catalytic domain-containing protein n=1 Tax=Mycena citricolor TaxID=2018698 RepID=A0AAD2Q497_9AGAR|nr:unnamed protein product [Mycena citricolor]
MFPVFGAHSSRRRWPLKLIIGLCTLLSLAFLIIIYTWEKRQQSRGEAVPLADQLPGVAVGSTTVTAEADRLQPSVVSEPPHTTSARSELPGPHPSPSALAYASALGQSSRASAPDVARWAPLSLSACLPGMANVSAPCYAQVSLPHAVYAEELLYPDFQIREPWFAQEVHRDRWLAALEKDAEFRQRAAFELDGWVSYRGQVGQNFIFKNAVYETGAQAVTGWSSKACMSRGVLTSPILSPEEWSILSTIPRTRPGRPPITEPRKILGHYPVLSIVLTPDASTFQHFLDRATHVIAQGEYLLDGPAEGRYVLTARPNPYSVQELWTRLGYPSGQIVGASKNSYYAADVMAFSCRAVLIVYMSRETGHTSNRGRHVINEEAVLKHLTNYLATRNRGEELVVFDHDSFSYFSELIDWVSKNALAIVGPHGGAMFNHRWCVDLSSFISSFITSDVKRAAQDTLVVEFIPDKHVPAMIWEEVSMLSQTYAAIVVKSVRQGRGPETDMVIDPRDVEDLLARFLDGRENRSLPLRKPIYPWDGMEVRKPGA